MQAVDVLVGVDGLGDGALVDVRGERELDEDAGDAGVVVEPAHDAEQLVPRDVGGRGERAGVDARLGAGARLVADVGGGRRIVADEDGGELRNGRPGVEVRAHAAGHLGADVGRDRGAVDDGGGHGRSIAGGAC